MDFMIYTFSSLEMMIELFFSVLFPEKLQLTEPEAFYYLSQSGCISDPSINDEEDFASVS